MSLFFRAAYLVGFKPWDSGVSPPELVATVEGDHRLQPGRFLDLGCGTGTNCVYLARHGWDATGVDFVPRAVATARGKTTAAGVQVRLLVGDVTRLGELGLEPGFDLVFDQGCFHSIPGDRRDAYVSSVSAVAKQAATMLLFCFIRRDRPTRLGPQGIVRGEVAERFSSGWEVVSEVAGGGMRGYDAAWYRLRRR